MRIKDIGKIVVTKDNEGNYYYEHIYNNKRIPLELSYNDFVESLETMNFDDAFYFSNSKNFCVKVSKINNTKYGETKNCGSIVFRDFDNIKNDELIKDLKPKIYPLLKKRAMAATKKLVLSGVKRIMVAAGAVGIIVVCTKVYKSGLFTDSSDSKNNSSMSSSSMMMDETGKNNTVSLSYGDSSLIEPEKSGTPVVRDDTYKDIKEKFNYYCKYYNFSESLINQLYEEHKQEFLNSKDLDSDIMSFIYEYYTEYLYDQLPVTQNTVDNEEQSLTILKYAKMKGVSDEEVLYTMLAVHDFETGWGKSILCKNDNNFGGNTFGDGFQTYPSYEVGAYDFVNDFMRIYKQTYTGYNSIEYDMNPVYCPENIDGNDTPWYVCIGEIKDELKNDNVLEEYLSKLNEKVKVR